MAGAALKYRMSYQKNNSLIFISQLDLQRMFQRAFMRAQVPLMYSNGFNPHPKMTYSPPVSMFISSACEYLDFETTSDEDPDLILSSLNEVLPDDIIINDIVKLDENSKSLSKILNWASYQYTLKNIGELSEEELISEYSCCELNYEKRNKKNKITKRDLKEYTRNFSVKKSGDLLIINACHSMENDNMVNARAFIDLFMKNSKLAEQMCLLSIRKITVNSDI